MDRTEAIEKLESGKIKVVFSVDMFNEGVDIPSVDMVMFLRPTESPIVFLQQLGRGLRRSKGKEYLNVLDFIGNYEKAGRVRYLLTGKSKAEKQTYSPADKTDYPDDCFVDFDMKLIDLFAEMDKKQQSLKDQIKKEYFRVKELLGKQPSRMDLFTYMDDALVQCENSINSLNSILTSSINDSVGKSGELFKTSINSIYDSLVSASDSLSAISTIINGVDSTLSSVNFTLDTMGELIGNVQNTLDKANTELAALKDDGKYELMQKLLDKDSSEYGEFFSSPVKVTTENVYEAVNYGTAVAPFYTTLALWVGGLLLTALIKTSPDDREEFKNATLTQKYFGRYLIFWLMGQIQAVITVLGDIYLLKIYCVHPGIFMLTASIVSFAFTLLIYTLTLSFGDVGKALAVVLVVIQIAGSSGTYLLNCYHHSLEMYIYISHSLMLSMP